MEAASAAILFLSASRAAVAAERPVVRLDLAPDQSKYDPSDPDLRDAANMLQKALNAEAVQVLSPQISCLSRGEGIVNSNL